MKRAFSTVACMDSSYKEVVESAAKAGMSAVEIRQDNDGSLFGLNKEQIPEMMDYFKKFGVAVSDLGTGITVFEYDAEKVKQAGITNVKFVAGDANVLAEFDTKTKCEVIYINFCDPWPKNGYRKRRLTHSNYLSLWEKLLCENGEIHFKTDNRGLFEFSLNSFSDYGMRLKNITLDLHSSSFEGNVMTEYETLFSEKGNPIYRTEAIFIK